MRVGTGPGMEDQTALPGHFSIGALVLTRAAGSVFRGRSFREGSMLTFKRVAGSVAAALLLACTGCCFGCPCPSSNSRPGW